MKVGEFISSVRNSVRALNKDERISGRYIYTVASTFVNSYLAQESEQKDMRKQADLFKPIRCFEMQKLRGYECGVVGFDRCDIVMKSVQKLPKIQHDNGGAIILFVRDYGGNIYDYVVNPAILSKMKSRRFSKAANKNYYYIFDDYLYIPDVEVEAVELFVFSTDIEALQEIEENNEGVCSECKSECESLLDAEFPLPENSKWFAQVRSSTVNEVAGIWRRVVEDENPDLDSNIKSKTVNAE